MNVKRIKARTTREALAMIRQSLGDEAVILSNRSVPGGVEIMAMPAEDLMVVASEAENAALRVPPPAAPARNKARPAAAAPRATPDDDFASDFASLLREAETQPPASRRAAQKVAQPSAARAYRRQADEWAAHDDESDFLPLPQASAKAGRAATGEASANSRRQDAANIRKPVLAAPTSPRLPASGQAPDSRPTPAAQSAAQALPPGVLRAQSPAARTARAEEGMQGQAATEPDRLAQEIAALRTLVETRLAEGPAPAAGPATGHVASVSAQQQAGVAAQLMDVLLDSAFSPLLARRVMEKFPAGLQGRDAQDWLQAVLVRNLQCARADQDPVTAGGVYAFVGPTGVGKTTTIAKLAARALVRHGAAQVALNSADSYRIGAQDQLDGYGRMLGLPVRRVRDLAGLRAALAEFADRKLVLIDTAGMSQRDAQVAEQQQLLSQEGIRRIVLLNASAQAETLDDVVRAYLGEAPAGDALTIVTKLDEAVKLGGVVDCAIRRRLSLLYVTTGQRVPEDLHPAHARYLVDKALRHAHSPVFARQSAAAPLNGLPVPRTTTLQGALHA